MKKITEYHCLKCGTVLDWKHEGLAECAACGYHYYENPKATVAMLVLNQNNELLMVKRAREPEKDKWDLPGGFVDTRESLEDALLREAREELKLELSKDQITYFNSYPDRYLFQEVNYHVLSGVFVARIADTTPLHPDDDVSEYRYFPLDQIPFEEIAFESMKQAVRDFIATNRAAS